MKLQELRAHPFLKLYLDYVAQTEPPRIMHLWAALSTASASMGRHVWFDNGIKPIFPNMYVLLVGPPATRKSTAIGIASEFLKTSTDVRFAPDDTGGQRQGLIGAFERLFDDESAIDDDLQELKSTNIASVEEMMDALDKINAKPKTRSLASDANCLFASASELGSFIGEANAGVTRLLNKVFDGEDYFYKIKNEYKNLKDPLLSILGGTTTSDLSKILPQDAVGQGFMSRWILVFASGKERNVFMPELNQSCKEDLAQIYKFLHYELQGKMQYNKQAFVYMKKLYESSEFRVQDSRFLYYNERRYTHLLKLAMTLAGTRKSKIIELQDCELAQSILLATEKGMPDALGEFGLSPISAAKQKMLEFLQHTPDVVSLNILWAIMQRDMKPIDFQSAVDELCAKGKIKKLRVGGKVGVVYIDDLADIFDSLVDQNEESEEIEEIENV